MIQIETMTSKCVADYKHSISSGFITYTCTNHPNII